MRKRLKVLLTEGSSTSARHVLYGLDRQYIVDILDPNRICQCRFSRRVHRHYRCPRLSKNPTAYLEFLLQRLSEEHYDVLFPTHEQVYLLARYRDQLQRYVHVALPDFKAMDSLIGKADFVRLLQSLELPHPETSFAKSRQQLMRTKHFPCFVKLDHSTAGEGVRRVCNADEMSQVADEFEAKGWLDGDTMVLVQRQVEGDRAHRYRRISTRETCRNTLCRNTGIGARWMGNGTGQRGRSGGHCPSADLGQQTALARSDGIGVHP